MQTFKESPVSPPTTAMTTRDRFHAVMEYGAFDRGVFVQPWLGFSETLDRWRQAGYQESDWEQFKTDTWIWPYGLFQPCPLFERLVLEEDARHVLYRNEAGVIVRELKENPTSSMPQFVKFPVETPEDFRALFRERFHADMVRRLGVFWVDQVRSWQSNAWVSWVFTGGWGGFFGPLRHLVGVETLCRLFYHEPAFVEEMMDGFADFIIDVMGQVLEHTTIDVFAFWEDMCYNHGPLISPDLVRRMMLPRYRRVVDFLSRRGVRWFGLDSDGRIDLLVPIWLEAGINLLFPVEVAAGMDVVALRRRFGWDLRLYGGIDKRVLVQGPAAIDRELERVQPLIAEGGYLAALDHSVPPNVPFPHFEYFMRRLEAILQSG